MTVAVSCPHCQATLKVKPELVGRKAKCPKCGQPFVLGENEPAAKGQKKPSAKPRPKPKPKPKQKARRKPPEFAEAPPEPAVGVTPGGFTIERVADKKPEPAPAPPPVPQAAPEPAPAPASEPEPEPELGFLADGERPLDLGGLGGGDAAPPIRKRRKKKKGPLGKVLAVAALAALVMGGVYGWRYVQQAEAVAATKQKKKPQRVAAVEAQNVRLADGLTAARELSPTAGGPIDLKYLPGGASIVVNLRPAELFGQKPYMAELRNALGPLGLWLAEEIERRALFAPANVEELTLAILLGGRGSEPELAGRVTLVQPTLRTELIKAFGGARSDRYGMPIWVNSEAAFVVDPSDRVFAFAPPLYEEDLVAAAKAAGPTMPALESVLEQTDRQRLVTVVFQPTDLAVHRETLVGEGLQEMMTAVVDWFGDDVEAAAWSLAVEDPAADPEAMMFSQLVCRPASGGRMSLRPPQLQNVLLDRMDDLPLRTLSLVKRLRPPTVGKQSIVGRLPAMLEAVRTASWTGATDSEVFLTTLLTQRAAPNLAAASLIAWDESRRAVTLVDSGAAPDPATTPAAAAQSVAERLAKPIDVEFNRTPLEEAWAYFGTETGVKTAIDGQALKAVAYTQNMPQTFTLGVVPAREGIRRILTDYDKMAVVVDEAAGLMTLTTKAAAEAAGQTPATFE